MLILRSLYFILQFYFLLLGETLKPSGSLRRTASHTHSVPNPIITITEHSPAASVQFFINQESDSQGDSPMIPPWPSITRSQTDANISYFSDTLTEAPASSYYVTKNGQL